MFFIFPRCTAFSYLEGDPDLAFFGVYDGHGGTGVANYLKDHLHEFILSQQEYKEHDMEEAILKAFLQVGKKNCTCETHFRIGKCSVVVTCQKKNASERT